SRARVTRTRTRSRPFARVAPRRRRQGSSPSRQAARRVLRLRLHSREPSRRSPRRGASRARPMTRRRSRRKKKRQPLGLPPDLRRKEPMSNRHPVDTLADVRAEIKQLEAVEEGLRIKVLGMMGDDDAIGGDEYIAEQVLTARKG